MTIISMGAKNIRTLKFKENMPCQTKYIHVVITLKFSREDSFSFLAFQIQGGWWMGRYPRPPPPPLGHAPEIIIKCNSQGISLIKIYTIPLRELYKIDYM